MAFLPDWKDILKHAWSIRLILLAALLSGIEVFLALTDASFWGLPRGVFAGASALVSAGAFLARLSAQPNLDFFRDEDGRVRMPRTRVGKATAGGLVGAALAAAVTFIGGWEGLRTEAYRDIVGVWTVCYGETKGVGPGDSYSKAECDAMLAREVKLYEAQLDRCLTADVPAGMKIALVSWTYNVGGGAACSSTLVRKANAGDLKGACNELPRWNRAGGRVINGLTNRRASERELCLAALNQ